MKRVRTKRRGAEGKVTGEEEEEQGRLERDRDKQPHHFTHACTHTHTNAPMHTQKCARACTHSHPEVRQNGHPDTHQCSDSSSASSLSPPLVLIVYKGGVA